MRILVLVSILLLSGNASAENLCKEKGEIPSDMQLPESHFNKVNSTKALNLLKSIIVEGNNSYSWYEVPSAITTIDGYIKKKAYLDSIDEQLKKQLLFGFCTFMQKKAYKHE